MTWTSVNLTDYTNKWKGRADEPRRHIEAGSPLSFDEIKLKAATLPLATTTKAVPAGKQYKPSLPMPTQLDGSMRRISFVKKALDVQQLGEYLFDDAKSAPSDVGSKCFDIVLRESKK